MGKCSQRRGSPGLAEPPMFLRGPPHPTGWPPPSTSMDKFTRPWRKLGSGWSRVYPALTVGNGVLQPVPETQFAPVTKVGERTRGRCTNKASSCSKPGAQGTLRARPLRGSGKRSLPAAIGWCEQGMSPDLRVRGRGPPDHTRGPLDPSEACVITAGLVGRARETILQMGRLRPTEWAWLAQDTLPEAGLD